MFCYCQTASQIQQDIHKVFSFHVSLLIEVTAPRSGMQIGVVHFFYLSLPVHSSLDEAMYLKDISALSTVV